MNQKFYVSTMKGKFIKKLLSETPLPIYDSVRPGDIILKGLKYIYNISLIVCTKSGTLEGTGEFLTLNSTFYFGENKPLYDQRFVSNCSYYDSDTHEELGRYLRCYRDIVGVNLMPFYNCFSGVYSTNFVLKNSPYVNTFEHDGQITEQSGIMVSVSEESYDTYAQGSSDFNDKYIGDIPYKTLIVPIKFNRKYSIYVDCDTPIKIASAFINHGKLVDINIGDSRINLTESYNCNKDSSGNIYPLSIEKFGCSFLHPFIYESKNENSMEIPGTFVDEDLGITYNQLYQRYQKYLKLLIQIPFNNTSSVVILEGDYSDCYAEKVFSDEIINNIYDYSGEEPEKVHYEDNREQDWFLDSFLISKLSLVRLNDKKIHPFSNSLIEYLLHNAIDSSDDIGENISRVQRYFSYRLNYGEMDGAWSNGLRKCIYRNARRDKRISDEDNIGYVNKTIEYEYDRGWR